MIDSIIIWGAYLISLYFTIFWLLVYIDYGAKDEQKSLKNFPTVTIAIPAYNEEKTLTGTVESAVNLEYPKNKLEILIINDGSKDNTKQIAESLEKKYSNVRLINKQNAGKGEALNTAIKQAKGEFFICLDADSFIESKGLKKLLPRFDSPEIASLLPRIIVRKKDTLARKMQWSEYILTFFYKKLMSKLNCIHVTPGPFAIYKTKIIKELGGFDPNNLTEDLEMALKIQKTNKYRIEQSLDAVVSTVAPKTFKAFYNQRNRWYKGSIFNFIKYHRLAFNPKYGDFGMMQMPMVLVAALVSLSAISVLLIQYVIRPIYRQIYDLSFVNFDIYNSIIRFIKEFIILDLNFSKIFFIYGIMLIGIIFMYLGFKESQEHMIGRKTGFIPFLSFLTIYPFVIFFIWWGVIFDLIRGKTQKW